MLTPDGKEQLGGSLRREDLCMVRIEASYRDIADGRTWLGRKKTRRVCAVTAYLRFDRNPDIDFIQVNGSPFTFFNSGDDLQLHLPPVLVTIS